MLNKLCWCYLNAMFQSGQCGVCVINFKKLVVRCGCVQFGFLVSRFRLTNDFRHRQRERRREHRHLIRCECFWVVWRHFHAQRRRTQRRRCEWHCDDWERQGVKRREWRHLAAVWQCRWQWQLWQH